MFAVKAAFSTGSCCIWSIFQQAFIGLYLEQFTIYFAPAFFNNIILWLHCKKIDSCQLFKIGWPSGHFSCEKPNSVDHFNSWLLIYQKNWSKNSQISAKNSQVSSKSNQISALNSSVLSENRQTPTKNSRIPCKNGWITTKNNKFSLFIVTIEPKEPN